MVRPTIYSLVASKNYPELFQRIRERFEITFDETKLKEVLEANPHPHYGSKTDDCIIMWLKVILDRMGCFQAGNTPPTDPECITSCVLHIAFLCLEETEEMLWRLREAHKEAVTEPKHAQSKIFTTAIVPHPIDRVANRVAPDPTRKD